MAYPELAERSNRLSAVQPNASPPISRTAADFLRSVVTGWLYWPIIVLLNVGLVVLGAYLGSIPPGWYTAVAIAGAGLVVMAVLGLPSLRSRWTREYERATAEELIALVQFYYLPILMRLGRQVGQPTREHLASVEEAVISAADHICGPSDVRVRGVLFEASSGYLQPKLDRFSSGQPSQRRFAERGRGPADKEAWRTARTGKPKTYPDLAQHQPPGFEPGSNKYATFSTCGILGVNGEVYGMLNIDAEIPDVFTGIDETVLELLARTLSVAYAVMEEEGGS